ncbi:MAG: HTH domain-containing protein [Ignavibacteria bacterium]|nr:HTH domain-containing protein [Ignavibacteria bacterium]
MKKISLHVFDRLVKIDGCFAKGRYVKSSDLSRKCNVSDRTIYRDLEILKEVYNAPLEYDFKRKSFHYTKVFQLKTFDLSAGGVIRSRCDIRAHQKVMIIIHISPDRNHC